MHSTQPRIAVAGAGLAGLTLAQRLVQDGWDVRVFERDAGAFARPQGYRITVDAHGIDALRRSTPGDLFSRIIATSGPPGGHFRITDENLRDAIVVSFRADGDSSRQMDRSVLRQALLTGLHDRVHYGRAAEAITQHHNRVTVLFGDGQHDTFDMAAVADGTGSTLSQAVFPQAAPADTGTGGIYGRVPLRRGPRSMLPQQLIGSGVLALLPARGSAFFMTAMRFAAPPSQVFGPAVPDPGDYVMWGLVLTPGQLDAAQADRSPEDLLCRARAGVTEAHPVIQAIVDQSDPAATLLSRFTVGRPPGTAALTRVAVLGDAIHPMPPFGAHGGNTALLDAALLGDKLAAARDGDLPAAIADYHRDMPAYAYKAVGTAQRQMKRFTSPNGPQLWMLRRVLPRFHRRTVP